MSLHFSLLDDCGVSLCPDVNYSSLHASSCFCQGQTLTRDHYMVLDQASLKKREADDGHYMDRTFIYV